MKRRREFFESRASKDAEEGSSKRRKENDYTSPPAVPSPEQLSIITRNYSDESTLSTARKNPPTRITLRSDGASAEYIKSKNNIEKCTVQFFENRIVHAECSCVTNEEVEEDVIVDEDVDIPPLYCVHMISLLLNITDSKESELRDLTEISKIILSLNEVKMKNSLISSISLNNTKSFLAIQNRILSSRNQPSEVDKEAITPKVPQESRPQMETNSITNNLREHYIPRESIKSFLLQILKESGTVPDTNTTEYFPGCKLSCDCKCHTNQFPPCETCAPQTIKMKDFSKCEVVLDKYIGLSKRLLEMGQPMNSYQVLEMLCEVFFVHLRPLPYHLYDTVDRHPVKNNELGLSDFTKKSIMGQKRVLDKLKDYMIEIGTLPSSDFPNEAKKRFERNIRNIYQPSIQFFSENIPNSPKKYAPKLPTPKSYQEKIFEDVIWVFKYTNDNYPLNGILNGGNVVHGFVEVQQVAKSRINGLLEERKGLMTMKERLRRVQHYTKQVPMGYLLEIALDVLTDVEFGGILDGKQYHNKDSISEVYLRTALCWLKVSMVENEYKNMFLRKLVMMIVNNGNQLSMINEFLISMVSSRKDMNSNVYFRFNMQQMLVIGRILLYGQKNLERIYFLRERETVVDDEEKMKDLVELCKLLTLLDCIIQEYKKKENSFKKVVSLDLKIFRILTSEDKIQDCTKFLEVHGFRDRMDGYVARFMEFQHNFEGELDMKKKVSLMFDLICLEFRKTTLSVEETNDKVISLISALFSHFLPCSIYVLIEIHKIIEQSVSRLYENADGETTLRGRSKNLHELADEIIFRVSSFIFCNLLSCVMKDKRKVRLKHFVPFFRISKKLKSEKYQEYFTLLASQIIRPDYVSSQVFPSLSEDFREAYEDERFLGLVQGFPTYLKSFGSFPRRNVSSPEQIMIQLLSSSKFLRHVPNAKCCSMICRLCFDWLHSLPSTTQLFQIMDVSRSGLGLFLEESRIGGCQCSVCSLLKNFIRIPEGSVNFRDAMTIRNNSVNQVLVNHIQRVFPKEVLDMEIEENVPHPYFMGSFVMRRKNKNTFVSMSPRFEERSISFEKNMEYLKSKEAEKRRNLVTSFSRTEKKITSKLLKSTKHVGGSSSSSLSSANNVSNIIRLIMENVHRRFEMTESAHRNRINNRFGRRVPEQEEDREKNLKKEIDISLQVILQEILKFAIHCTPERIMIDTTTRLIQISKKVMKLSYRRNILLSRLCEQSRQYNEAIELQRQLFLLHPNVSNFQQLEKYQKEHQSFFTEEHWEATIRELMKELHIHDTKILQTSNNNLKMSGLYPNAETVKTVTERLELYVYLKRDILLKNALILATKLYIPTRQHQDHVILVKRDELVVCLFQALKKRKIDETIINEHYEYLRGGLLEEKVYSTMNQEQSYYVSDHFFHLAEQIAKCQYKSIAYSLMDQVFRKLVSREYLAGFNSRIPRVGNAYLIKFVRNFKKLYELCQFPETNWKGDVNRWILDGISKPGSARVLPQLVCVQLRSDSEICGSYHKAGADEFEEDVIVMGESEVVYECPILLDTLHDPVKNKVCGHVYSREGAALLIGQQTSSSHQSSNSRCPIPGCQVVMVKENLLDDHETKRLVEMKMMLEESDDDDDDQQRSWTKSSSDEDDEEEDDIVSEEEEEKEIRRKKNIQQQQLQQQQQQNIKMDDKEEDDYSHDDSDSDSDSDVIIIGTHQGTGRSSNINRNRNIPPRPPPPLNNIRLGSEEPENLSPSSEEEPVPPPPIRTPPSRGGRGGGRGGRGRNRMTWRQFVATTPNDTSSTTTTTTRRRRPPPPRPIASFRSRGRTRISNPARRPPPPRRRQPTNMANVEVIVISDDSD